MIYVYALVSCSTGKIYIGQTINLEKRLKQHNEPLSFKRNYTKLNKGPWKVFYKEITSTRKEAILREKQLKSARGREFLKNLLIADI